MLSRIKDPVSCLTHLAGAVAALFCAAILVRKAIPFGPVYVTAFVVFGASMVMLYTASALYHMLRLSDARTRMMRRIDHTMIFILIAGTYTPVCLIPLRGPWGWSILAVIWGLALAGAFMKIFWLQAPRLLSTTIYVIMGWLVIVAFYPLLKALSTAAFVLLVAGGLAYTVGAVIYFLKWPPLPFTWAGFHEIFHIFVLLGTALHVLFMFQLFPS